MGSKAALLVSLCVSLCVRIPGALCPIFGTPVNMCFEEEPYKNNSSGHQGTPSVWPTQRWVRLWTVIGHCFCYVSFHPVQINTRLLTQTSWASVFVNVNQLHQCSSLGFIYLARENTFLMASVMRYVTHADLHHGTRQDKRDSVPYKSNQIFQNILMRVMLHYRLGTRSFQCVVRVKKRGGFLCGLSPLDGSKVLQNSLYQLGYKNNPDRAHLLNYTWNISKLLTQFTMKEEYSCLNIHPLLVSLPSCVISYCVENVKVESETAFTCTRIFWYWLEFGHYVCIILFWLPDIWQWQKQNFGLCWDSNFQIILYHKKFCYIFYIAVFVEMQVILGGGILAVGKRQSIEETHF